MEAETALLGFLVGLLVGLTGVGGAALLTPVLLWFGINPSVAVGTDLFYNAVTKLFGGIQHLRQKTVDLQLVKWLAAGSMPGAVCAVLMVHALPALAAHRDDIIRQALGVVLIAVAVATIIKQFYERLGSNRWQDRPLAQKKALTIALGASLGFVVGLTSIGSGSLFALAMIYFYRMTAAQLVGTDIVHAFLLAAVASGMHAFYGNIDYALAINLLAGSVPGVLIGSRLSAKVPGRPLRTFVAALILASGLRLL